MYITYNIVKKIGCNSLLELYMPLSNRLSTTSFQEIEEMKTIKDTNGNGTIEFTEFEHMMAIKIIERDVRDKLVKAFHIIDQYKYVNAFISIHHWYLRLLKSRV